MLLVCLVIIMSIYDSYSGLRVKEKKEVYEGEVTELNPVEVDNALGGYGTFSCLILLGLLLK